MAYPSYVVSTDLTSSSETLTPVTVLSSTETLTPVTILDGYGGYASSTERFPSVTEKSRRNSLAFDSATTLADTLRIPVTQLEPEQKDVESSPPRTLSGWKWTLVVVSILSSLFFFSLDNTIVAVVQTDIIRRFDALDKLPWLVVAYVLGSVAMVLFWGRLYALFDGKLLYLTGLALFQAGSAICGAAPSMDILIVGRAMCGVGGVGLYAGVLFLLTTFTTDKERPMYIGMTGIVWGLGTALGPIVGGVFTETGAGWRWAFYINLVIGGVGLPVYLFMLPSSKPRPNDSNSQLWKTLDWVGVGLSIVAFLTGTMAINFGGVIYDWGSPMVITLFVISFVFFVLFGIQQAKAWFTSPDLQLFPAQFVLNKDLVILCASIGCGTTLIFTPIYFLPLYFQYIHGVSGLDSGIKTIPFIVSMIFFVFVNGGVMAKTGIYWPWYTGGSALAIIGSSLLYTIKLDTSDGEIYGYSVLAGIGTGCFVQASFSVAQSMVHPSLVPRATSFITLGQLAGGTIGTSIANSVFLNQATSKIMALLPGSTKDEVMGFISGLGGIRETLAGEQLQAVNQALLDALNLVYILCVTAAAFVFVCSFFLKRQKLFLGLAAGH
jgi:MFS family permease